MVSEGRQAQRPTHAKISPQVFPFSCAAALPHLATKSHLPKLRTEMQTLSPNPPRSPNPMSSIAPPQPSSLPFPPAGRGSHHRRAQSEVAFRIPDDLGDPMAAGAGFDEAEDDLFCTFMDIDKIGSGRLEESGSGSEGGDRTAGDGGDGNAGPSRPKHRHSVSVDGVGEVMEAKKAMAADKLAELAAVDPKRVKRILANRQSAARSKERKARYILELERKVQTLQTEATTLSAQLTLFQRDTSGLTSENTELKLRLQAMEQQAQLRDALNNALKHEVERLRVATGETVNPSDSYDMGLHQTPLNSLFFTSSHQQMDVHQGFQSQQHFPQSQPIFSNHQILAHHHALSDIMMQQDPLGRMQELDISKGSHMVKSESSSISASESSSTF